MGIIKDSSLLLLYSVLLHVLLVGVHAATQPFVNNVDFMYSIKGSAPSTSFPRLKHPSKVINVGGNGLLIVDTLHSQLVAVTASSSLAATYGTGVPANTQIIGDQAGEPQFAYPYDVQKVGSLVYVADTYNYQIQVLTATYQAQATPVAFSTNQGGETISFPFSIAVSGTLIWVTDAYNRRVKCFNLTPGSVGNYLYELPPPAGGFSTLVNGVAVDASGNVYVVDSAAGQILAYNAGSPPTFAYALTGFNFPQSVTIDANGNLVVCNTNDHEIVIFHKQASGQLYTTSSVTRYGAVGEGNTDNSLHGPTGISADSTYYYVADTLNNRIRWFTYTSAFAVTPVNTFVYSATAGDIATPTGIAYDSKNDLLFVVNSEANNIGLFNAITQDPLNPNTFGGLKVVPYGSGSTNTNGFNGPVGISYDSAAKIAVVADTRNQRVLGYSVGYTAVGAGTASFTSSAANSIFDLDTNSNPNAAVQCGAYMFIADSGSRKFVQYDATATLVSTKQYGAYEYPVAVACGVGAHTIAVVVQGPDRLDVYDYNVNLATQTPVTMGSTGSGTGEMRHPAGVVVKDDRYWVVEEGGDRVSVFESDGTPVAYWGSSGNGASDLSGPSAITASGAYVYVADTDNNRVQVFCGGLPFVNYTSEHTFSGVGNVNVTLARFFGGYLGTSQKYTIIPHPSNPTFPIAGLHIEYGKLVDENDSIFLYGTPAGANQIIAFTLSVMDDNNCPSPDMVFQINISNSYNFRIDSYSPVAQISTNGYENVTITGRFDFNNFFALYPAAILEVYIGGNPCINPTYSQDTFVYCFAPEGVGYKNQILVKLYDNNYDFAINATYNYFSYAPPTITTINNLAYSPVAGYSVYGQLVEIVGTGFGNKTEYDIVTVNGLVCTAVQEVYLHQRIKCQFPYGAGNQNHLVINVGNDDKGFLNTSVPVFFNKPYVTCQTNEVPVMAESTSGGHVLTIYGANFGGYNLGLPASKKRYAEVAQTGVWTGVREVYVKSRKCHLTFANDTEITCILPPGAGTFNRVWVNINSDIDSWVQACTHISYPHPVITHIVPARDIVKGMTITIFGKNFAFLVSEAKKTATIGDYECTNVHVKSDGELTCVAGDGTGHNMPVRVYVADQVSTPLLTIDWKDAFFAGLNCQAPRGGPDFFVEKCNCFSGYSPADLTQKDCSVHSGCPGAEISNVVGQFQPHRPKVSFGEDRLVITQQSPVVHHRRDFNIKFAVAKNTIGVPQGQLGEESCFYPGPIWTKTVSSLDCLDEFHASMPWSQHAPCGFVSDSSPASLSIEYKAELVTEWRDIVISADMQIHQKLRSVSYLVVVKFVRQLHVKAGVISAVFPALATPRDVGVVVTSSVLLDPVTQNIVFSFVTTLPWPYAFGAGAPVNATYTPSHTGSSVNAYAIYGSPQSGKVSCTKDQETNCEQEWGAVVSVTTGCTIDGTLTFNTTDMRCRDAAPGDCPVPEAYTFVLSLSEISVCQDNGLDATASTQVTMASFEDADNENPSSVFNVGDRAFFEVQIIDPVSTIDYVTIESIALLDGSAQQPLFPSAIVNEIQLNYTDKPDGSEPTAPGLPVLVDVHFLLHRAQLNALSALNTAGTGTASVKLSIVLNVGFHGNQKRVVVNAPGSTSMSATHPFTIVMEDTNEENAELLQDGQTFNEEEAAFQGWFDSAASNTHKTPLFGVIAGVVIALFAVLF